MVTPANGTVPSSGRRRSIFSLAREVKPPWVLTTTVNRSGRDSSTPPSPGATAPADSRLAEEARHKSHGADAGEPQQPIGGEGGAAGQRRQQQAQREEAGVAIFLEERPKDPRQKEDHRQRIAQHDSAQAE